MAKDVLLPFMRLGEPREPVPHLGYHEEVDGSLSIDVPEGETLVVLVDNSRWNLFAYDLEFGLVWVECE